MSTEIDETTETTETRPLAEPDEGTPQRFTRPGKTRAEQERLDKLTTEREDEPPADVPRDRYDQPIIVLPDGSGVLAYRRASKGGGIIEDTYGLTQWHKRTVVWGMSRNHGLVVRGQSVQSQTAPRDIATLQDIADRAEIIAGADIGAMTGTGLHKLSERRDAGEDLSWLDPTSIAALDAYAHLLSPFEVLATELFVIWDDGGFAGTLDRAVRLLVDLVWPDGVVIPAGTIVIIDIKTGKIKSAQYWGPGFSVQQLTYALGVPYFPGTTVLADPDKRSVQNVVDVLDQPGEYGRVSWDDVGVPGGPSPDWALILHVPAFEPERAHWERVDLAQAREDAEVARLAWARHRVSRHQRFLALPAAAFDSAVSQSKIENLEVDTEVSTDAPADAEVQTGDETHVNPQLVAILLERIYRADSIEVITQLHDSWGASPSWTDAHADACEEVAERLTPPADVIECDGCNYDRHNCPGCGIGVAHGKDACPACELRLLLTDAPDAETVITYWEAHKPVDDGGDGLWADEHTQAAQARYDELEASTGAADEPPADEPEQQPETDRQTVRHCHECTDPEEDPRPWCDCNPDETCMDAAATCRNRAHAPEHCPMSPDYHRDPVTDGDEPECTCSVIEPGRRVMEHAHGCPMAEGITPEQADEPGPFDSTLSLAELREALQHAESITEVDDLYDAHKAVEDGGDGLWDDECTTLAQAAYDRHSPSTVPS